MHTHKKIRVIIQPDGKLAIETLGFAGKSCLAIIPVFEELSLSHAIDSRYQASANEQASNQELKIAPISEQQESQNHEWS